MQEQNLLFKLAEYVPPVVRTAICVIGLAVACLVYYMSDHIVTDLCYDKIANGPRGWPMLGASNYYIARMYIAVANSTSFDAQAHSFRSLTILNLH